MFLTFQLNITSNASSVNICPNLYFPCASASEKHKTLCSLHTGTRPPGAHQERGARGDPVGGWGPLWHQHRSSASQPCPACRQKHGLSPAAPVSSQPQSPVRRLLTEMPLGSELARGWRASTSHVPPADTSQPCGQPPFEGGAAQPRGAGPFQLQDGKLISIMKKTSFSRAGGEQQREQVNPDWRQDHHP